MSCAGSARWLRTRADGHRSCGYRLFQNTVMPLMKAKTKIPIRFQSEASDSIESQKRLKLPPSFRTNARQILCSFSMMLTERERMALHWLSEGLTAPEIARRLQIGDRTVIEASHKIAGGARSLALAAPPDRNSTQNRISGQHQSLAPVAAANPPNENPS